MSFRSQPWIYTSGSLLFGPGGIFIWWVLLSGQVPGSAQRSVRRLWHEVLLIAYRWTVWHGAVIASRWQELSIYFKSYFNPSGLRSELDDGNTQRQDEHGADCRNNCIIRYEGIIHKTWRIYRKGSLSWLSHSVIFKQDVRNNFNKRLVFWILSMASTGSLSVEKVESFRSQTALFIFSSCLPAFCKATILTALRTGALLNARWNRYLNNNQMHVIKNKI